MVPQLAATVLGIWLMVAPAALGYAGPARTADRIVGPLVVAIAFVAVSEVTRPVRRANLLTGVWLIVAPWLFGYSSGPAINSMVVGVLVMVFALQGDRYSSQFGGGWSSLWSRRSPAG